MNDGLEARRLAELGMLSAQLVHELRQPVFAIKALAQLAEADASRAGASLTQILTQVAVLEQLLHGYGDLGRRPARSDEVFDLRTPVDSAMIVLERRAQAARVRLDVDVASHAVRGAPLGVQQALVNLVQNALEALAGRADGRVRVTASREGPHVYVRVSDNGPGLAPDIRANLFQPFHTTKPGGTGLGLSLSRDVVRLAGGDLRLEDTDGTTWLMVLVAAGAEG